MTISRRTIPAICAGAVVSVLGIWLVARIAGCGSRHAGPEMDPETAAAYAAIPSPGAARIVPSWFAVTNAAALKTAVTAREGTASARLLAPLAVELPCRFSCFRADRACWDFAVAGDFSREHSLAFDFWCGDVTQFTGFSIYFKSGEGWYQADFSPMEERRWHRVDIARSRVKTVLGKPAGWNAISAVRICGWRGGTNDTQLAAANFAFAAAPPAPTEAQRAAREREDREWAARQPSRKGEWRGFWCHNYRGLGGGKTWNDTVRLLKDNGFTALLPNLAWAGTAFYKSDVLRVAPVVGRIGDQLSECLSACRAHGIECHVWKICWNLGHHATKGQMDELSAAGRTQVRFDGTARPGWLCPSHPDNLAMEIRAFLELARRGVDGVHLDYIRYPDESHCFCAGCRRRFESSSGLSLTNWPAQVRQDPEIKAMWREFRITNITALVRSASTLIRKEVPGVKISAAVFQNPETNPNGIGQDWAAWCRAGYLDFVCPMDYNYDSPVAFKGVVFAQKRALAGMGAKTLLRPGIGLSCWHDPARDVRMAVGEILAVRAAGLDGFCFFDLGARAQSILPVLHSGPTR